jgi:hypothetical protein
VTWSPLDPLLTLIRQMPLVGQFLSSPQAVNRRAVATYRVRLGALLTSSCPASPCYEAVLLDTAL